MSLLEAWISAAIGAAALPTSGACKENGKFLPYCPNLNPIASLPLSIVTFHGRGMGENPFSSHFSPFCLLLLNETVLAGQSLSYY